MSPTFTAPHRVTRRNTPTIWHTALAVGQLVRRTASRVATWVLVDGDGDHESFDQHVGDVE